MTKKELIEKLEADGINIGGNPSRMITKFVSLGLIEKPIKFGLGKGKGTVADFSDKVLKDVADVVSLHGQGLTYEEIRLKRMNDSQWDDFVTAIKRSSKSISDFRTAIKAIPYISTAQKGALALKTEVAEHLTNICIDELGHMFSDYDADDKGVREDLYGAFMFCLDNVFFGMGLRDEDYEKHADGQLNISSLSPVMKFIASSVKTTIDAENIEAETEGQE